MKAIHFLKPNDTIDIVAPSFGCATEPYASRLVQAEKNFNSLGYNLRYGENVFINKGAASNTAKKRAKEFMNAYKSDSKLIISAGGGEIMCEILPYINFNQIKKLDSKIFLGYSDNTNLTFTLTTISDVKTIYGPCVSEFGSLEKQDYLTDAILLMEGKKNKFYGYPRFEMKSKKNEDNPYASLNLDHKKILKCYPNKEFAFEGRIIGGCIDILQILCGTKYDNVSAYIEKYKDDGIIWFMEACDLNPLAIRRALFQLREAGWFKYVKGFVFGRPLTYKTKMFTVDQYKACKAILKEFNVPIIMDADIGHYKPMLPILCGAYARISNPDKNICIEYDLEK